MSANQDSTKQQGPIGQKVSGLKKVLSHGPTRLVFLGGIGLAFVVAVFALNALLRTPSAGDGNAQLPYTPTPVEPTEGARGANQPVNTGAYDALTVESNAQMVAQAKETGGTAMPVPRVGQAKPEEETLVATPAGMAAPAPAPADASAAAGTGSGATAQAQQAHEAALDKRYEIMASQYDRLVQRWTVGGQLREAMSIRAPDTPTPATAGVSEQGGRDLLATPVPAPDIRANDTSLAIAISEANTDDQLPIVRARLLSGPAKGAVLLGSIEMSQATTTGRGLIRFNQLTPAGGGASVPINAIAIDPRTSRSSVASSVNRHTVSRLGALFFSSILSGVSEGLLKGGQEERVISSGQNIVVQRDAYSDRDLALIGLGKVGANGAQMMQGAINRRPTVKLNLNSEIGVLFLQDVVLEAGTALTGMP